MFEKRSSKSPRAAKPVGGGEHPAIAAPTAAERRAGLIPPAPCSGHTSAHSEREPRSGPSRALRSVQRTAHARPLLERPLRRRGPGGAAGELLAHRGERPALPPVDAGA